MSVRVMTFVWALDLPDSQKIVLLALADCANDEGHCWPSMATLAKKCSKGERTVQGVIKELVAAGHLDRQEVSGKGCKYIVHPRRDCAPAETAPPQRLRDTPAAAADKPSRTIIGKEAKASFPKRARDKVDLPDWVPADPWDGFVEMRKSIGHRLTPRGAVLAVGRLEELRGKGHDPGAVLDQSTMNNWRGLFEVKDDGRKQHLQPARESTGETAFRIAGELAGIDQARANC